MDLGSRAPATAVRRRLNRFRASHPDGKSSLRPKGAKAPLTTIGVLNAICEEDFLGFSSGFRPKRGQQGALDALVVGITIRKVNFVLNADIRSYFDTVNQAWLIRFLKHRINDPRMIRLIQKWLKAGILEDGIVTIHVLKGMVDP